MEKLVKRNELKWIFVSGKGGVGKTTCSSSLAAELSKHRESVLLISTDPAHNLGDAWDMIIDSKPKLINGYKNLYCMEFSNKRYIDEISNENNDVKFGKIFNKLLFNIPGVEEALGYVKLIKEIMKMNYSVIVFDTAPTGHTLKLLEYPKLLKEAYYELTGSVIGGIFKSFLGAIITDNNCVENKLDSIINNINLINYKLTDPDFTTFINVCIPEFLSVFETERFIQELYKNNIDSYIIIINQVLENQDNNSFIESRKIMQLRYLNMIEELYLEDFDIIQTPLLEFEVRGKENLERFAKMLYNGFRKSQSLEMLKLHTAEEEELDNILEEAIRELDMENF